jgi:phosphocarrier protein HPr
MRHAGCAAAVTDSMSEHQAQPDRTANVVDLVVKNKMGIHARPAAMIVRIANKYDADIYVEKGDDQVNGKSIMGLMMLAAGSSSKLKFTANGPGADEMLSEIKDLFDRLFDEE